jgi:phage portal protein BeeE
MSDALTKAIRQADSVGTEAFDSSMRYKEGGGTIDVTPSGLPSGIASWQEQASYEARYELFRGWVYAAINVLASEGAGRPPVVARMKGSKVRDRNEDKNKIRRKNLVLTKCTKAMRSKAAEIEMEVLEDHFLIDLLNAPNSFQGKWQFVYSFVANLCLTGWSYVVVGMHKKKLELYSLPTSWVKPIHDPHPFAKFEVKNPKAIGVEPTVLDRTQVGFAHLPNPSDPLSAMAPAGAQMMAIRVDDHIQTSQETFFRNGIFPSVLIRVGKTPGLDSEYRPMLTGVQRRHIISGVKKIWGGVANYGQPAIVDGLIENIERLSATQNEMGWNRSEGTVKTRILSAFAVHPFLLGENVSVGGHAQVAVIKERMYDRTNTYLDMLSNLLTNLLGGLEGEEKLIVGFEESKAVDYQLRQSQLQAMRDKGDLSRNEMRAEAGYPPEEQEKSERSALLESVGGMTGTVSILTAVGQGAIQRDAAIAALALFLQISEEEAEAMVGPEPPEPPAPPPAPEPPAKPPVAEEEEEPEEMEEAVEELKKAVGLLDRTTKPLEFAEEIVGSLECSCEANE